jgi:hypothetical protein
MLLPSLLSPLAVAATIFQGGVSGGGPTVDPGSLRILKADGHLGVACPLAGRPVPDLPAALAPRLAVARATLGGMRPEEFRGAELLRVRHKAGMAELDQSASDFLFLFGMPNFMFHLTMGYAALRAAGVVLGKADFDGFHAYPESAG